MFWRNLRLCVRIGVQESSQKHVHMAWGSILGCAEWARLQKAVVMARWQFETRNEQVGYSARLDPPALELLSLGAGLYSELLENFRDFGVSLADIRTAGEPNSVVSQSVSILFGKDPGALLKLSLEQIEFIASSLGTEEMNLYPSILQKATDWLLERSQTSLRAYDVSYYAHGEIVGTTARDFLQSLTGKLALEGPGEPVGHGVIFRWLDPARERRTSLTLDHSLSLADGVYIGYSVKGVRHPSDMQVLAYELRETLYNLLDRLGLLLGD